MQVACDTLYTYRIMENHRCTSSFRKIYRYCTMENHSCTGTFQDALSAALLTAAAATEEALNLVHVAVHRLRRPEAVCLPHTR